MKKLFLTFLLVLLPLQFAQAAMCAYCCDEEAPSSLQSSGEQATPADDVEQHDDKGTNGPHHSCGTCHLSCAKFFVSQPGFSQPSTISVSFHQEIIDYKSYIPRSLERPKWTHFA